MADTGNATITLPYERFKTMEQEHARATARAIAAEKALRTATRAEGTNDAEPFADAALQIVQYAVGNLNPESNRGWPRDALALFADQLAGMLPNYADDIDSMVITLKGFVREIDDVERLRDERRTAARAVLAIPVAEVAAPGNDAA